MFGVLIVKECKINRDPCFLSCTEIPAEQCDYDEDSEDDSIDGDSETEKEPSTEKNGPKKGN